MRNDPRIRAMVRLNLTRDVGPVTFKRLMEAFGEPERVFEASRSELISVHGIGETTATAILSGVSDAEVDAELALVESKNISIIPYGEEGYPRQLMTTSTPPLVLYVMGSVDCFDGIAVGMVGTRHASHYGRKQARRLAGGLASSGVTVISGMARGIDSECHLAAIEAGGKTIAVLGTGLGVIYPTENAELYYDIVRHGALLSEYPVMTGPAPGNFPRRNRIVAGLSAGVVVVEAGYRSGALITARLAMEENREVFAVPGMVDSPGAGGCHRLIKDGARLVESVADILEALGPLPEAARTASMGEVTRPEALTLNEVEQAVYARLDASPLTIDELVEETGLGVAQLNSILTILEMRRLVKRLAGQCFARA